MDLKSVLVAMDASETATAGARGAAAVAAVHGSHLIGLHVVDIPVMPGYVSAELPSDVFEIQRKHYMEAAAGAQQRFQKACEAMGLEGEWRCVEGRAQPVIETHARYVDLLCTSGPRSEGTGMGDSTLSEDLVLSAGKPVLICPDTYEAGAIGEYVTIAWDGSREAARAVSDAMGILCKAKKVSVVAVRSGATDEALGALPGTDLSHHLARHGVQAEAQSIHAEGSSVGDALLTWAKGQGSDLIVMGAYGHSRFREVLLGGVTRRVLSHARLPVLMSH